MSLRELLFGKPIPDEEADEEKLGVLDGVPRIAWLVRAYGVGATEPGGPEYESVLSQLVAAVMGRGPSYYAAIASMLAVLCLSANTSFADFPRLCRQLALDEYLPEAFAHAGPRLVYSSGIVVLAVLAALLLAVFRGITDRLIPLFAVGAFSAFTLSQAGMVAHWARERGRGARRRLATHLAGAIATAATLVVIAAAKFRHGAWMSAARAPALALPPGGSSGRVVRAPALARGRRAVRRGDRAGARGATLVPLPPAQPHGDRPQAAAALQRRPAGGRRQRPLVPARSPLPREARGPRAGAAAARDDGGGDTGSAHGAVAADVARFPPARPADRARGPHYDPVLRRRRCASTGSLPSQATASDPR